MWALMNTRFTMTTDDQFSIYLDKHTADSREDVPKPKPQLDPREENKRLDLESPISGPGRRRNVAAVEEPDQTDLKVSITEREKHGTKTDTYVMYKICTDVSLWEGG